MLIAGDIGGTKTELAIFSNEGGPHRRWHTSRSIAPITLA